MANRNPWGVRVHIALLLAMLVVRKASGEMPAPALDVVFPAGAAAGQTTTVNVLGRNLQGLRTLHCNAPGVRCEKLDGGRVSIAIPTTTPPGQYDLWAVSENGVSAPRTFSVGNRAELLEKEPNDSAKEAQAVSLNVVINGRIDKGGDQDHFRFDAKRGQRVVIECWAERIDSRLRAVLELFDAEGRRLAANRGYFGSDPLIDFRVPADGAYVVKLQDLIFSGSAEHYYRLDIDTGPRVAFTVPSVVERGKSSRVRFYGWNLPVAGQTPAPRLEAPPLDHVDVDIPDTLARESWPLPVRLQPAQAVLEGFAYHLPGSHASVVLGVTDVPVALDRSDNHTPASAQLIAHPCEVSGQLIAGDEVDWFAIQAKRGEVLYLEALGQRIHAPVDLQLSVLDAAGEREFVQFSDEVENVGGKTLPTSHLDAAGRWVVPADGRYLIAVRNLSGGLQSDPRRIYRLSVRREEPDFQLVIAPRRDDPAGLTLLKGGREALDVVAFRRRGMAEPIRIAARDLPSGIDCPDVWLGRGVDRATLVVSARHNAATPFGELKLEGMTEAAGRRAVRGGTVVRAGTPNGWSRITSQIPIAVAGIAPLRITADGHETVNHHLYGKLQIRHSPGGVLDINVRVERREADHRAPVKLVAVGLPESIRNQTAILPPGESQGYLSLYLPPTLSVGKYSLVVRAETTVPAAGKKTETVAVYSNPVTIDVRPAAFLLEVDPFAPTRVKRGEVIQVGYSAPRRNGFIGKIHTELAAPGLVTDVVGLRGRGATFVGQTEKGTLQIVVNKDAPLGPSQFLRLFSVGVLEDEPIFHGAAFLPLEIVE